MSVMKPVDPVRHSADAVALFSYVFSLSMVLASFVVQEMFILAWHLGPTVSPWNFSTTLFFIGSIGLMGALVGLCGVVVMSVPLALALWGADRLKITSPSGYAAAGLLAGAIAVGILKTLDELGVGGGELAWVYEFGRPFWKMLLPALCGALAYWHTARSLSR